jgi:hypothetical protein
MELQVRTETWAVFSRPMLAHNIFSLLHLTSQQESKNLKREFQVSTAQLCIQKIYWTEEKGQ